MTPHEQRPIERVTQARKRVEMTTERADFPEDKYMHEIHRLKTQRDELLAACELLMTISMPHDVSGMAMKEKALTAIKKAKGE